MSIPATCPQCQAHFDVLSEGPARRPRSRFPWSSLAIVLIGLLLLLLIFSMCFNVWLALSPDRQFPGFEHLRDAEQAARAQQAIAEQSAVNAQLQEARIRADNEKLKRDIEDLKRQLDALQREKDDGKN